MVTLTRAYEPINASDKFDGNKFKAAYIKVNSLEKIAQTLDKNPQDFDAIDKAGAITMGNPDFYNQFRIPGKEAKKYTVAASNHGRTSINEYSINNSDGLYSVLAEDEKTSLLLNSKIIQGGDDSGYTTFAGLINLDKDMNAMLGDAPSEEAQRINFVAVNSQYSPMWLQEIQNGSPNDKALVDAIFREYQADVKHDLQKTIFDENGNRNMTELNKFSDINFDLHKTAETKDYEFFRNLQDQAYTKL